MEPETLAAPDGLPELLSAEGAQARGSTARTRAANALVVALTRAARSFLLYDSGNEAIHSFLAALNTATEAYRALYGALTLEVRPFEIVSGGEVVYLDRDRERSIAFRLYRDGVRRLDISAEVPWHEILKLLEILSIRYTGVRQAEDDMVVLLWKAGFSEIQVEAVEGVINEEFEDTRIWRSAAHVEAPLDFDLPPPALPGERNIQYAAVLPGAREQLLEEDESPALPHLCVRLGFELLAACARGELGWYEIVHQLGEMRDFLLAEGVLLHLLELAHALIHTPLRTPHDNLRRAQFLATFADEAAIGRVLRGMRPDALDAPPELIRLLELCPGDHLHTLLSLVVTERSEVGRRVARTLLERWVPAHGPALLAQATSGGRDLACELLRVFRYADPALCLEAAAVLADRPEVDVQLAVVHALDALAAQPPPRVIQSLLGSPSIEVRLAALDHVARRGIRSVFPALLAKITRAGQAMEQREADAYAIALAEGDGSHALETFRDWIRPRGLFAVLTPVQAQLMHAALAGLARVPGEDAEALIKQVAERGGGGMQAAALMAMRERRRAGLR